MKLCKLLFVLGNTLSLAQASRLKGAPSSKKRKAPPKRALKANADIDLGEAIGIGCFSERATVELRGHKAPVSIRDLQVGDQVLTADNRYSPVYAFGHRNLRKEASFVRLETREKTLELTGDHLVFLNGKKNPVRADTIQENDVLRGKHAGLKVFSVKHVDREGVYAPFTPDGTLVVNGILASSYVSFDPTSKENVNLRNGMGIISHQAFAHMGLSPFRLLCQGMPVTFSANICQVNDDDDGLPLYVSVAIALMRRFQRCQSMFIQSILLTCIFAVTGSCFLFESIVGAEYAPIAVLVLVVIWSLARSLRIRIRATVKHS